MNMTNKIEFTDSAKKEIERIVLEKGEKTYFRISVQGGGCSGFKYNFSFDDKVKPNDEIFNKTIVDRKKSFWFRAIFFISVFCKTFT